MNVNVCDCEILPKFLALLTTHSLPLPPYLPLQLKEQMAKYYVDREYAECMKSEICTEFPENHNAYFRQHQFGFDLDTRYIT